MLFFNNRAPHYVSWKEKTNNVIVAKNVLNEPTSGSSSCTPWNGCDIKKKYNFKANPIRHYRKQYTTFNANSVSYSNRSFIGVLDKPGNYIVTKNEEHDCAITNSQNMHVHILNNIDGEPKPGDKFYDASLNKTVCIACNPQSLVMKPATTVLSNNYSSSNREYLNKKCRTYDQNLPLYNLNSDKVENGTMVECNNNNCKITYNPSNKKYMTQGPVSGSARIAAIKYQTIDKFNKPKYTDIKNKEDTDKANCRKCDYKQSFRRSGINMLK